MNYVRKLITHVESCCAFICKQLPTHPTDTTLTLLLALVWSPPTAEKNIWLFSLQMSHFFHQLVANFVCSIQCTVKWIYCGLFADNSWLLLLEMWLMRVPRLLARKLENLI